MSVFAAQPDTMVIEIENPVVKPATVMFTPIVGWINLSGALAFPVCAIPGMALKHGRAVRHSNGYISDPTHGLCFKNQDEWLAFMRTAKTPSGAKSSEQTQAGQYHRSQEILHPEADEELTNHEEPVAADPTGITFGTKTYKTKSYWSMPDINAIFPIEGNVAYPADDRCVKVTREQFAELKREGSNVIDPHTGVIDAGEPAGDDDAMDLV